jgi:hypothetical protein
VPCTSSISSRASCSLPTSPTPRRSARLSTPLKVDDVAGAPILRLVDNQSGSILAEQLIDDDIDVHVVGSDQDDRLSIDFDPAALAHTVRFSFDGGAGSDTLRGPTGDNTWIINATDSGEVAGGSFSGVENLEGAADNEDTFVVEAGGHISGSIEGGAGGFDSLMVSGTFNTLIFTPTGPHSGYVDRDGDVIAYDGLEPVDSDATAANVVFNGDGGGSNADTWILEDSATAGKMQLRSTTGQIETTQFDATATSVTLNLGADADVVTLASVGDSGFNGSITVNGEGDDDSVTVQDLGVYGGTVTITGGAGSDTLSVNGTAGADVITISSSAVTINGTAIAYSGVENVAVHAGAGDDTITVNSLGASVAYTIDGGADTDTLDFNAGSGGVSTALTLASGVLTGTGVDVTLQDMEKVDDANIGIAKTALATLLNDLETLSDWARQIAAAGDFASQLPLLFAGDQTSVNLGSVVPSLDAIDAVRADLHSYHNSIATPTAFSLNALGKPG